MNELNKILKQLGITQQEVADKLDLKSLGTANLKINGKAEFTTKEANILKNLINSKSDKKYTLEELFVEPVSNDS